MGQAFRVALQHNNISAAECFLRDLSLKQAIDNGVKKEDSIHSVKRTLQRRNSIKSMNDETECLEQWDIKDECKSMCS